MKRRFKYSAVLGLGIIAIILLLYVVFLSAPRAFKPGTIATVGEGTSLHGLSSVLVENGLIRSRAAFEAFVITYGGEKHVLPGDYLFEYKMPVYEVAHRIARGEHHLPPVKVTIPEGFTNADIALAFSAKLANFNQANFLAG